ncbi:MULTISPECIES: DHA2 family efflux MFS transporter permease subunit [unclassified Paludibacterium]|uniref:DHA2 family efflux MFS transporter permease subunit n=1 Tax=unclassified Paludibacterium TaxID=2618429 RepID=UPI001C057F50|nr:DHA2 family efflux MFS transporter permease subunit [Paludibacterium sp. B53371]BEV71736.1 multidrug efflux MFS transporter permease subunit VceB [Paludibacterium sp. THUN1379]
MSTTTELPSGEEPLHGVWLLLAALALAAANFIAVLDTTIANVSVSNIAGALGVTSSQGTWVITSYAVAEAITVPLTGWLAARFGAVRVFATSMALFGLCSALCGLSNSLGILVAARVLQGLSGGPLMPLSQTLLLRIFPKDKAAAATGIWAMTTLVAPILGPILGGVLCDSASWPWIFMINVPVALICALGAWRLLKRYEQSLARAPIDLTGLCLLILWVGSLQIMLDEGKDLDWFSSVEICLLAIVAVVGFLAFLIWELTAEHPVVDLRVFRHRGYSMSLVTLVLAFGAFFGINVLTPLWLQNFMGYTATWAGMTTAWSGVLAVLIAPGVAALSMRVDGRRLVFIGVCWMGLVTAWRSMGTTDMTYWQIATPLLLMGLGMPLFFVPLTGLALAAVDEAETASAAGLMNFLRTLAGAFATSMVSTVWEDRIKYNHADLVAQLDNSGEALRSMQSAGLSLDSIRGSMDQILNGQAVMLATNQVFLAMAGILIFAASSIWLAPRARRIVEGATGH